MVQNFKMVSKISYFVIIGIIVLTNGNPAYRQDYHHGEAQYDLNNLMGELVKQGKYDVMLNHHEDRPGTHHEDITQLTYNGGNLNSRDDNYKYRNAESSQSSSGKNLNSISLPSRTSIQNLNLFLRKKPRSLRIVEENNNGNTNENAEDLLTFLNNLDNTLNVKGGSELELRCYGNRCGESRGEGGNTDNLNIINDNDKHLRCNGKRCSIAIDSDRNGRDNLRCLGNRCSRSAKDRDDNDDRDILNNLRCVGDRCGINRDDDKDDDDDDDRQSIYTLRCVGDRCGINRDDDEDDDDDRDGLDSFRCVGDRCSINRDGIDKLRCIGNLCSINRDDDDDDDDINTQRCIGKSCSRNRNDDYGIDTLRCIGDRCSRDRDDDKDDDNDRNDLRCVGDRCGRNRDDDDDDRDNLRCIGNRCGRSRIDYESQDTNPGDQDDDEAEAIVDNLLSNYVNLRGNDYSSFEGSEKRNVKNQVKSLLANLKNGLIQVVHGVVGLKPPSARPVNL